MNEIESPEFYLSGIPAAKTLKLLKLLFLL